MLIEQTIKQTINISLGDWPKNKAPTWKKSNFLLNIYKFFIKYIQKWTSKTEL